MATVGNLVVNLSANTSRLRKGLSRSQGILGKFGSAAGRAGGLLRKGMSAGAGAAVGLKNAVFGVPGMVAGIATAGIGGVALGFVKAAASAETLKTKLAVLTKSGDTAEAMFQEIGEFAASTPFQKLDIADAAQKLLAFGTPANDVMDRLQNIGDIAALTGVPINELAEIYGKAQVQGRLFAEDINQLTGRGIPIIQELAKQFGVTEQEVKKLVTEGKVGGENLTTAFAAMTTGQGQFAGGMAKLSQTTAGKFSTMKDNFAQLAESLGAPLLGPINTAMMAITSGVQSVTPILVGAFQSAVSFIGGLWQAWGPMVMGVMSGVVNWVMNAWGPTMEFIKKSIAVAGVVMNFVAQNWQTIFQLAINKAILAVIQLGANISHFFTGVLPALFTWFTKNWGDIFFTAADFVLTTFINLGQNIRNIWTAILDFIKTGEFSVDWTPLTEGFKNTVSEMPDIPARVAGPLEQEFQSRVDEIGGRLGTNLNDQIQSKLAEMDAAALPPPEPIAPPAPEGPDVTTPTPEGPQAPGEGEGAGGRKPLTEKTMKVGLAKQGSAEAFKAIIGAGARHEAEKMRLDKQRNELLRKSLQGKEGEAAEVVIKDKV